jgi:Ca2+-binding EF-hand superfamily protein
MKNFVYIICGLFFLISTSLAADMEDNYTFESFDGDGNGYISKSEANKEAELMENWSIADADKNGRVDVNEFSKFAASGRFEPPDDAEISEPGAAPFSTADVAN